ncbi:MAG: peptidase S8, partial [Thermus sp.]
MHRWFWLAWLLLSACTPSGPSLTLAPSRAALGEEVEARLSGMSPEEAQVFVSGVEATVTAREAGRLRFTVPMVAGGPQPVRVVAAGREARTTLSVLGQVDRTRALLPLPL